MDASEIDRWTSMVQSPVGLYELAKSIDSHRGEGTWPIYAARAQTFYGLRRRQFFYEPLGDFESLLTAARLIGLQHEAALPRHVTDSALVVFEIFESAIDVPDGRLLPRQRGEHSRGLHAVRIAGWEDEGDTLVFANSWGRNWGHEGYGYLTREYFNRHVSEAWLQRNARYGPTRFTWKRLREATSVAEQRRAWLLENPRWRWRLRYAGRDYQLVVYETLSVDGECPVDVVELRNHIGIRVGWAEVFHPKRSSDGTSKSVVKELFVWPPFRRRGYGSIIESIARRTAAERRSDSVEIVLLEVDARPSVRAAPREFAAVRGYDWKWRKSSMPPVAGVAISGAVKSPADCLTRTTWGFKAKTSRATAEHIM